MSQSAAPTERKKVGMLVPPPALLVGLAMLAVAAQLIWIGSFNFSSSRTAPGLFVIVISVAGIAWCGMLFRKAGTPFRPVSPSTAIVSSGPYRFSRNPMYVGMAGVLAGSGVVLGSYFFAVAAVIFVAIVHLGVVLPEERYMETLHGETYRRYKQSVRRWL